MFKKYTNEIVCSYIILHAVKTPQFSDKKQRGEKILIFTKKKKKIKTKQSKSIDTY